MIYGASPAEWDHFAGRLGLRQDLLPVVSDPTAEIAEYSRMQDKGKTPSRFDRDGKVIGLPKWTQINADEGDIRRWSRDDRIGICIQTRFARAIDIDVADPALSAQIEAAVRAAIPGVNFPKRYRANSGKMLLPFLFEGELYKRSFPVGSERVELLAYGQQFIAKGTHPSGVHYLWEGGLPDGFPLLTAEEVEALWDTLEMLFATGDSFRAKGVREGAGSSSAGEGTDSVLTYLAEHGLILEYGASDQAYIECPWASEHSSDNGVTQTAYFPANTGGYARGHFKCMHDHCAGREDSEFLDALGVEDRATAEDDFEDLGPARGRVIDGEVISSSNLPVIPGLQDGADIERAIAGSGRLPAYAHLPSAPVFKRKTTQGPGYGDILVTQDNVSKAFEQPEFCTRKLRWDTFRDCVVWAGWNEADGSEAWRPWGDVDYARAARTLDQRRFISTPGIEKLRAAVMDVAMLNEYDSAIAWLQGLPAWDGTPRIDDFLPEYLGAEDNAYTRSVGAYMWTALAGRVMNPGCKADMAIILVDPEFNKQGRGKTSLVEAIAPDPDWFGEIDFAMKEEDAGRTMRGKVVIELAELAGLRGKALEAVKKFISRRVDEWVPKYVELPRKVARRGIFIGTTNETNFLNDPSGERRWLPVVIGRADIPSIAADREQLWAEALERWRRKYAEDRARGELEYRSGIEWAEAERLAKEVHADFKQVDEWDNEVARFLGTPMAGGELPTEFTTAEVFASMDMGNARVSRGDQMRMGDVLKARGWSNSGRRYVNGVKERVWRRL